MENAIEYLIKVNGLLILFYIVYTIFLQKETFFQYNRWFLNVGLLASLLLPLVILKKIVWIETPLETEEFAALPLRDLQQMTPVISEDAVISHWYLAFIIMYIIGFFVLFIKFIGEYVAYRRLLKNTKLSIIKGININETEKNIGPFSFFNAIVMNPKLYSDAELQAIIAHEKVHVGQYHSVDVLVSKLFAMLFWYNPIIWLYNKYVVRNLEYIADNKAVEKSNNLKQYQYTLLKHTTNNQIVAITNPFYQSLIKKRIVMLNKKSSSKVNRIKLAIIIPMLAIFIWQFQTKIVAQEKVVAEKAVAKIPKIEILINRNTTAAFMAENTERLKREYNIDLKFSKIKRNEKGELTAVKVFLNDNKGSVTEHEVASDKAIEKFLIVYDVKEGRGEIGFYAKKFKDSKEVPLTAGDHEISENINEIPSGNAVEIPEPPMPPMPSSVPTPPMPPSFKAYQGMFKNMPKPPTPPRNSNDKNAMTIYEKSFRAYEEKMAAYEKNIEQKQKIADADMEKYDKQMTAYDDAMKEYDDKMRDYDEKVSAYSKTLEKAGTTSDSLYLTGNERHIKRTNNTNSKIIEKREKIIERKKLIDERKKMIEERKISIK